MSILNKAQFAGKIRSVKTSAAHLREAIQELCISAAYYTLKDRNTTPFAQLLEAVGDGTRRAGITAWAETFANCRVVNGELKINKKAFDGATPILNEQDFEEYAASTGLREVLWYTSVEPEKVASVFDAGSYLTNVLKKLNKEGMADLADHVRRAVDAYNLETALKDNAELAHVEQ